MSNSTARTTITERAIRFTINERTVDGNTVYQANATIPGFRTTAVLHAEGGIYFPTRSAALKACKRRALALGYTAEVAPVPTAKTTRATKSVAAN